MTTKKYNPLDHSIVQAFMKPDATHEFEVFEYVEALMFHLHRELKRVYWNWHQKTLEESDWQLLDLPDGMEFRRYYWGDEPELGQLPNFKFRDVIINWYKYIGRGMSTNKDWNEKQWREWFDAAMSALQQYDVCMIPSHLITRKEDSERIQCKNCSLCMKKLNS